MRQGRNLVGEFAKKSLTKTKVAFQGENKSVPNKVAIDFFIKGLHPDIRKAIRRLSDPPDFETAAANAEKEQRILEQERREEREILESINALVLDDKEQLQKQVNSLQQRGQGQALRIPRQNRPSQPTPPQYNPQRSNRQNPPYRPNPPNRGNFANNRRFFNNLFHNFWNPRNFNNPFNFSNRGCNPLYFNPGYNPAQQQQIAQNPNYPQQPLTQLPRSPSSPFKINRLDFLSRHKT
ncbi:hypothetical protein ANCCEY_04584 [Ancylostoma ceylanicum]|uniref:Uncharacterized protein n=1 Tax=Ancylostoma ceylanicum TaxID=53326 RepID=A0A0D6M916_9BILA|nr:hypothetical protein ANCCEY_04584 [Ancylostoma ceylanicum]